MRIGKKTGLIVASYLIIGGLIGLTQLGISKLIEPPACNGIPVYTLLENFSRSIDVEELPEQRQEKLESLASYFSRFGRSLTSWLPDHLKEITGGEMTLRNYSLGGFRCFNYPLTSSSESLPPTESGSEPLEEPEITKHDVWGEPSVLEDPKQK
jgi:hypothetical protein